MPKKAATKAGLSNPTTFTVVLPRELADKIKILAKENFCSAGALVRQAIQAWLSAG